MRRAGVTVGVVSVRSASGLRRAIASAHPRVVILDSIAFGAAAGLMEPIGARVIALVHMRLAGPAARAVVSRADRTIAVSTSLRRQLRALGARRVTIIAPGRDAIPRVGGKRVASGALRAISVANWSRVKGIGTVLAALRRVPGVRVTGAGDRTGGYARQLERRARALGGRVRLVGSVGAAQLARLYRDADVAIVASRTEGYATASAEAIAQGIPVIASDIAGVRATLGSAALFVRPSDVRALARALERMHDPRVRRRLAAAASRRAASLPRWRDTERAFVSLVEAELQHSVGGGDRMPPRGVKSPKRKRQYEKIKKSEMSRGRSTKTAKRIAAATTNKTRRKKGETKGSRKRS